MTRKKSSKSAIWNLSKSRTTSALADLIEQGSIAREGDWYRIHDVQILSDELFGLVKRLLVNNREILVKL